MSFRTLKPGKKCSFGSVKKS